jgi:hypothetical protein
MAATRMPRYADYESPLEHIRMKQQHLEKMQREEMQREEMRRMQHEEMRRMQHELRWRNEQMQPNVIVTVTVPTEKSKLLLLI